MRSFVVGAANRLFDALQRNPILFNSATGCVLFSGSDALAQDIEHRGLDDCALARLNVAEEDKTVATSSAETKADFNKWRFFSAGIIGVLFGGFVYPFAYAKLDSIWKGVTFVTVLKKSVVEIATVGIFVNSVSISCRGLIVGHRGDDVAKHTLQEMPTVTVNDARVWLPYNLMAFSIIPIYIRPVTTSLMEAMWQTYISLCSHSYGVHNVKECASVSPLPVEEEKPIIRAKVTCP